MSILTPTAVPGYLKDFVEPHNRPALDRATRDELLAYAKTKGMKLDANMPRDLIIQILREKGYTDIKAAVRIMGMPIGYVGDDGIPQQPGNPVKTVSAADDLKRQWEQSQAIAEKRSDALRSLADMSMKELRDQAKTRGIKLTRTDTMQSIREKLNG